MFQFNMDSKSKGIVWVGNIYQRFEAVCLETDDMVCQVLFTIPPFSLVKLKYYHF